MTIKPALEPLSFEAETHIHVLLLRVIGALALKNCDLEHLHTRLLSSWFHLCYGFFSAMYLCSLARGCHDVEHISETIILLGSHSRFLILHARRAQLARLLAMAEALWSGLETRERRIAEGYLDKSKAVVYAYLGSCLIMCTFYTVFSQLMLPATVNGNETNPRVLPFDFFVNVQSSPWFELVLVLQAVAMFSLAITSNGIDTAGPFVIMMACGFLRTISCRMQEASNCDEKPKDFARTVLVCVKFHQAVLEYCSLIQTIMGSIFVTQLISTTYNMSLLGLKVIEDDPDKSKYVMLIIVLLIQLIFLQWAPDMLIEESKAVADNSYLVPPRGYEDAEAGRLLRFIIMRAQQPIELRAGGYVRLSMESFGAIFLNINDEVQADIILINLTTRDLVQMLTNIMSLFTVLHSLN